jgi:hypothetical protein
VIPAFTNVVLRSPASWLSLVYRVALLGVVGWLSIKALSAVWHFTIDDSGISYAYAKHLAEGLGPVAAPGAPWVEGYSNALWVFLMVPLQWLGLSLPGATKWLAVALFASMLGSGVWLLVKDYGLRLGTAALGAFWLLVLGVGLETVVWVVSGLENALLGALLIGLLARDRAEREDATRLPLSGLIACGVCLTRPEGAMYAGPIVALRVFDALRDARLRPTALRVVLAFVVPLVVYHAVHYSVFHEWVPNTYYAKPQRSSSRGWSYLTKGLKETGLLYLVPLAVAGCFRSVREKLGLAWYCTAGVVFVLYSGGDWMPHHRFVSFFAAPLVLSSVHGLYNLGALLLFVGKRFGGKQFEGQRFGGYEKWVFEGVALAGLATALVFWQGYHAPKVASAAKSKYCHFCQRTKDAQKLQKTSRDANLGPVSVLTHDFGGPSWVSDESFYPIDFLGLCDASIARIRRSQEQFWPNSLVTPYVFHEQPRPPSWIYLPVNFWRRLKELPEYNAEYYSLSSRLLPHAPSGSYVALHKGHLVDFFPPVHPSVKAQRLSKTLGLVGAGWFTADDEQTASDDAVSETRIEEGARVRVVVSVLPLTGSRGDEKLWVEVKGAGKPVRTPALGIPKELRGVARQLSAEEPLRFDFDVTLPAPAANGASYQLSVGSQRATGKASKGTRIGEWNVGDVLSVGSRTTPRLPSGLPVATAEELKELQPQVAAKVERGYVTSGAVVTPADVALAARLRSVGDALRVSEPRQAYLAYVWATQVNPREWEKLTETLIALRSHIDDASYAWEFALLREYYATLFAPPPTKTDEADDEPERSPTELAAARLIEFYERSGRGAQQRYFEGLGFGSRSSAGLWPKQFAFEETEFGWSGDLEVFGVEMPNEKQRLSRRGLVGAGWLSSGRTGASAKGSVVSPAWTLSGSRLSFLFAGGNKSDVGVELVVDGQVVAQTSNHSDVVLQPVWWDISSFSGKPAQLRVYDKSTRRAAYLDEVLEWN